jgi:hypothetical protein
MRIDFPYPGYQEIAPLNVPEGTMAVKPGGSLILVAPNPEGVADNHPNLLEIGYRPHGWAAGGRGGYWSGAVAGGAAIRIVEL